MLIDLPSNDTIANVEFRDYDHDLHFLGKKMKCYYLGNDVRWRKNAKYNCDICHQMALLQILNSMTMT